MNFSNFVGNENVKSEWISISQNGVFPHAVIIDGAKGTGKKTLANIISQACVCQNSVIRSVQDNKDSISYDIPCGKCAGCMKAFRGTHPDITVCDGNVSGSLNIDSIRNIRTDAYIMPNEAPRKVYILSDSDKMLPPAQNALLKILEEPPQNVIFIITVTSANMLLETVRSRSRIYTLYPPAPDQAAEYLKELYPQKSYEQLLETSITSDGNIGSAIQSLENGEESSRQLANDILLAVIGKNEYDLLLLTSELSQSREFASAVLGHLLEGAGECLRASAGLETNLPQAKMVAEKLSQKRIYKLSENIQRASSVLKSNVNLNFFGTWLCSVLR